MRAICELRSTPCGRDACPMRPAYPNRRCDGPHGWRRITMGRRNATRGESAENVGNSWPDDNINRSTPEQASDMQSGRTIEVEAKKRFEGIPQKTVEGKAEAKATF